MDEILNNDIEETARRQPTAPPVVGRGKQHLLRKKLIPAVFISVVSVMVVISVILSIVRSVQYSSLNILLGTSLLGLLVVQVVMIMLARSGGISRQKTWFVYVVGLCLIIESILTNVVMFG
jgi:hypothetical protein